MSKIGRKPIDISGLTVEIQGNDISFKGKKMAGVHTLPDLLKAEIVDGRVVLKAARKTADTNRVWVYTELFLQIKLSELKLDLISKFVL